MNFPRLSYALAAAALLAVAAPAFTAPPTMAVEGVRNALDRFALPRQYPAFVEMSARGHVIPGLRTDYVPQGIAWVPDRQVVILSYYWKGEGSRASLLVLTDLADGAVLGVRELRLPGEGGARPYTGHAGGVTVLGDHLWTGSGGKLVRFPLESVFEENGEVTADAVFDVDSKVSFLSSDRDTDTIWLGEFRHGKKYPTATHHSAGGKSAWAAGYRIGADGRPLAEQTYEVEGRRVLRPDRVVFLRDRVQGMAVAGRWIVLSVSYGSDDSKLALYRSPLDEAPRSVELAGGAVTDGWVIEDAIWEKTVRMPPGSEDLEWTGEHLLVSFECGADPYRVKRRLTGALIEDRYHALKLAP